MDATANRIFPGGCACGAVRYRVHGPPVVVAQCHCETCRRISGTGHTIGAMFPAGALVLDGDTAEFGYVSDTGSTVTKGFCPRCGSPIFGKNTGSPAHVTLSLGTMDDAAGLEVQVVIHAGDAACWDRLGDGVATFRTQPDWRPG